jgi:hypothetical protein
MEELDVATGESSFGTLDVLWKGMSIFCPMIKKVLSPLPKLQYKPPNLAP